LFGFKKQINKDFFKITMVMVNVFVTNSKWIKKNCVNWI